VSFAKKVELKAEQLKEVKFCKQYVSRHLQEVPVGFMNERLLSKQ